jgi:hypothetical protein
MLVSEWKNESAANKVDSVGVKNNDVIGWSVPEIKKYAPLMLPPSATVFHYGLEVKNIILK